MKRIVKELLGGIFLAVSFVAVTLALIKSPAPEKYLPLY